MMRKVMKKMAREIGVKVAASIHGSMVIGKYQGKANGKNLVEYCGKVHKVSPQQCHFSANHG